MAQTEYTAALSLLELGEKTDLGIEDMISMAESSELTIQVVDLEAQSFSASQLSQLESRTILEIVGGMGSVPITFVKMGNQLLQIQSTNQTSVIMSSFNRAAFVGLLFSAIFLLFSILSSWRIARPVSQLTLATQHISKGDFSVQLPEDQDDEMGDLMRAFNEMTDALERTSAQQKDFISSVSHEFKTPIASIKGYARLLQMDGLDADKKQEYIGMIAQEADRLSRLSETLLRLSALEQQTDPASITAYRLDEQARQVILRLEPLWEQKDISFDLQLDEVTLESDAELLGQVWVNIIQNAIKFSPEESSIAITVSQESGKAVFRVQDHGIGMSEEARKRIFDRFYQEDRSRSREGVGLGMSLVRRILNILGGEIAIESEQGKGTTMTVRVPLKPLPKADAEKKA